MTRFPTWLVLLWLLPLHLLGCASEAVGIPPLCGVRDEPPSEEELRLWRELKQRAEVLCRHQLLTAPVLSRLPEGLSPSELIRQEDLDFVRQHPSPVQPTALDRPGLYASLTRFSRCAVEGPYIFEDEAELIVRLTRHHWEDPSLLSPEVLAPSTPAQRLEALVRWHRRHPGTVTTSTRLRLRRTPAGWRADYQLPEQEERRLHPLEIRSCPEGDDSSPVAPFEPGMTPPRYLSGPLPRYTRDATEARVQGLFIARCQLTREGEARECCIRKPLPYMEESILRALSQMRFTPARKEGQPLDVTYDFRFGLFMPEGPPRGFVRFMPEASGSTVSQ